MAVPGRGAPGRHPPATMVPAHPALADWDASCQALSLSWPPNLVIAERRAEQRRAWPAAGVLGRGRAEGGGGEAGGSGLKTATTVRQDDAMVDGI